MPVATGAVIEIQIKCMTLIIAVRNDRIIQNIRLITVNKVFYIFICDGHTKYFHDIWLIRVL